MKIQSIPKKSWLTGLATVFFLLFLYYSLFSPRKEAELIWVTAARKSFDIRVNTIGELDAAKAHLISSSLRGDTAKLIYLVEDGLWVEAGEVLARFDPSPLEEEILTLEGDASVQSSMVEAAEQLLEMEKTQVEKELKAANYEVIAAGLDLKKLKLGEGPLQLAQLEQEVEEAQDKYQRHQSFVVELTSLQQQGFTSEQEVQQETKKMKQLERSLEIAESKLTSYRDYVLPSGVENAETSQKRYDMQLEQGRRAAVHKIGSAMAAVKKSRQQLDGTLKKLAIKRDELEKTVLLAPVSGIVILSEGYFLNEKRKPRVGDTVWQGRPILYLPDISSFVVKTKVRELDLHKIMKGQDVDVRVDAYPDTQLRGKVLMIGALAESSSDKGLERNFQLVVGINGRDDRLRPGMTTRISILNKRLENVVAIPVQALYADGDRHYCYRIKGSSLERIQVEPGQRNEDFVEIKSGVQEGDRLSLLSPEERQ